jgi:BirA family biotin operon repressor/biotin-[acetyl-CoA-carboxylase] ligase
MISQLHDTVQFIWLNTIDSTNKYATHHLQEFYKPITVIVAENQYQGRGQRENEWHSEPGKNILLSIVINPTFLQAVDQFYLTKLATISILQFLESTCQIKVEIKWPNDIYCENKKLAGILIENSLVGSAIKTSIIGIGLNVNQLIFNDLSHKATSLAKLIHQQWEIKDLIYKLINYFETLYCKLQQKEYNWFTHQFQNHLFRLNQPSFFTIKNKIEQGTIVGVDLDGCLKVIVNGNLLSFNNKEIAYIIE